MILVKETTYLVRSPSHPILRKGAVCTLFIVYYISIILAPLEVASLMFLSFPFSPLLVAPPLLLHLTRLICAGGFQREAV